MIKDDIKIIKKFVNLIKIKKLYLMIIFFCLLVLSIISVFTPYIVSQIIGFLTSENPSKSYFFALIALLMTTLYFIFNYINKKYYIKNYNYYFTEMHKNIYKKIIFYDEDKINKLSKGKLFNILTNDINNISLLTEQICELIISWIKILVIFVICCKYNVFMSILIILFDLIGNRFRPHALA